MGGQRDRGDGRAPEPEPEDVSVDDRLEVVERRLARALRLLERIEAIVVRQSGGVAGLILLALGVG